MRISDWSSDVCSSDLRGRWTGPVEALGADPAPAPLIVDALFGVGLSRPLADHLATRLRRFAGRRVLAVDVPSGVDADGLHDWTPPLGADVTLALGALKPAHVLLPADRKSTRLNSSH